MKQLLFALLLVAAGAGLHFAQPYVLAVQTPVLIVLVVATTALQGYLHATFYAGERFRDIHGAAEIMGALHFLLAYAAGLNVLVAYGATMVGTPLFQGFINLDAGRPFVDPDEGRRYEVGGKDWTFKRLFVGRGRYLQALVGLALIAAGLLFL